MDHSDAVLVSGLLTLRQNFVRDTTHLVAIGIPNPLPTQRVGLEFEALEGIFNEALRVLPALHGLGKRRFGQGLYEHPRNLLLDAIGYILRYPRTSEVRFDDSQCVPHEHRVRVTAPGDDIQRVVHVGDGLAVCAFGHAGDTSQFSQCTFPRPGTLEDFLDRLRGVGFRVESAVLQPVIADTSQREVRLDLVHVEELRLDVRLNLCSDGGVAPQNKVDLAEQGLTQPLVLLLVRLPHQVVEGTTLRAQCGPVLLHGVVGRQLLRTCTVLLDRVRAGERRVYLICCRGSHYTVKCLLAGEVVLQPLLHDEQDAIYVLVRLYGCGVHHPHSAFEFVRALDPLANRNICNGLHVHKAENDALTSRANIGHQARGAVPELLRKLFCARRERTANTGYTI